MSVVWESVQPGHFSSPWALPSYPSQLNNSMTNVYLCLGGIKAKWETQLPQYPSVLSKIDLMKKTTVNRFFSSLVLPFLSFHAFLLQFYYSFFILLSFSPVLTFLLAKDNIDRMFYHVILVGCFIWLFLQGCLTMFLDCEIQTISIYQTLKTLWYNVMKGIKLYGELKHQKHKWFRWCTNVLISKPRVFHYMSFLAEFQSEMKGCLAYYGLPIMACLGLLGPIVWSSPKGPFKWRISWNEFFKKEMKKGEEWKKERKKAADA